MKISLVNLSDNKIKEIPDYINKLKKIWPECEVINYVNEKDDYPKKIDKLIQAYNDDTNFILCLNGGTTVINLLSKEIISRLFNKIKETTKPIVGYSDIDHISLYLSKKGYNTINGPCLKELCEYYSSKELEQLKLVLNKKEFNIPIKSHFNCQRVKGKIIASNIQILCMMHSKLGEGFLTDKILFLEDHTNDEKMIKYYIDFLSITGILKGVKAIVLGETRKCPEKSKLLEYMSMILTVPIISIENWIYLPNEWFCEVNENKIIIKPQNDKN